MREFKLVSQLDTGTPATAQSFTVPNANQQRLTFQFMYVPVMDRWVFNFFIDDQIRMQGRKVVVKSNLLAPFGLRVGALIALDLEGMGAEPNLQNLTNGTIRLFHLDRGEQVNVQAAQVVI